MIKSHSCLFRVLLSFS